MELIRETAETMSNREDVTYRWTLKLMNTVFLQKNLVFHDMKHIR